MQFLHHIFAADSLFNHKGQEGRKEGGVQVAEFQSVLLTGRWNLQKRRKYDPIPYMVIFSDEKAL